MNDRAVRFDVGGLGRFEKTQQGFLRVPGNVTRVGVLNYLRTDGSTFRELRHPDEVFRGDSLGSLSFAPVTDRHPAELVSPRNVRDLQVGIVTNARRDGRFMRSDLIVQDARMIAKVERGDARELSAGYTCRVDATPGEFEGERFDGIQRDITYNHVALGPRDWGRAGPEVALHIDGLSDDLKMALGVERFDDELAKLLELHPNAVLPIPKTDAGAMPGRKDQPVTTKQMRIDGLDYEVPATAAPHIEKYISGLEAKIATQSARADKAEGERDSAQAELAETKTKLDAATDPEAIQTAVRERVALEASARKVLGPEAKIDGSDREIKVSVLVHQDESFDAEGKSDAYIDGRFDSIVEQAPERRDERSKVQDAVLKTSGGAPVPVTPPVAKIDSAEQAKRAGLKAARERGRQPLPSARKHA